MKANSMRFMIALLAMLLLDSFAVADQFQTVDQVGEQDVICVLCTFGCDITIADIEDEIPGTQVEVPIEISVEDTIKHLTLELDYDTGLSFNTLDTSGTEWQNSSIAWYPSANHIEIQFTDSGYVAIGDNRYLATLVFDVDDTVAFNTTKLIQPSDSANVYKINVGSSCKVFPDSGSVKTIDGEASFMLGTATGYSYQGKDGSDDAKDTLIYIPVYFKANFPSDYVKITCDLINIQGDYENFYPEDNVIYSNPPIGGRYLVIIDATTNYSASEDWILLGTIELEGHDYNSSYNASASFSATDSILFVDLYSPRVKCEDATAELGYSSINKANGAINYPVYSCATFLLPATADTSGNVDIYISTYYSFWAQSYFFTLFAENDYFSNISATKMEAYHPDAYASPISGDYWSVGTSIDTTDLNGKYILPGSNTICKVSFDVDIDFMNDAFATSNVTFYSAYSTNAYVRDFFSPNSDKIQRDCEDTSYFDLASVSVKSPAPHLGLDSVYVTKDRLFYATVPINLSWINTNNVFDTVRVLVSSQTPAWTFDDSINFSCDYDSLISWSYTVDEWDIINAVGVISSPGSVDYTGELFNVIFKSKYPDGGVVDTRGHFAKTSGGYATRPMTGIQGVIVGYSAKEALADVRPLAYNLSHNFPNPFNATTTIQFSIVEQEMVQLDIYDILGRKVNSLVSDMLPAGEHQVVWNGKNTAGNTVSSGYYFYKLTTPNYSQAKKMLLLK